MLAPCFGSMKSIWLDVVYVVFHLKSKGVDFISNCKKVIGNGEFNLFLKDVWLGDVSLMKRFPRIYFLELDYEIKFTGKLRHSLFFSFRRLHMGGVESEQHDAL